MQTFLAVMTTTLTDVTGKVIATQISSATVAAERESDETEEDLTKHIVSEFNNSATIGLQAFADCIDGAEVTIIK